MMAARAIYSDGWFANTSLRRLPWDDLPTLGDRDQWELYDLSKDFSQSTDLASKFPDRLKAMQALFDKEARANNVYPLDGRFGMARSDNAIAHALRRTEFTYWGKDVSIGTGVAPSFVARSFTIRAEVTVPTARATGVLLATGSWFGGWSFYLKDGRPVAQEALSQQPAHQYVVTGSTPVQPGKRVIEYRFTIDEPKLFAGGTMEISVDGKPAVSGRIPRIILHTAGNGETFDIGRDTGAPVTDAHRGEGLFPGDISKLIVTLGGPDKQSTISRKEGAE
jgi:arylsulfatase